MIHGEFAEAGRLRGGAPNAFISHVAAVSWAAPQIRSG